MKFTAGYWRHRPGATVLHPRSVDEVVVDGETMTVHAPTQPIRDRGDTLNQPMVSVRFETPMPEVVAVTIEHHRGGNTPGPEFDLHTAPGAVDVQVFDEAAVFTAGRLSAHVSRTDPWSVEFTGDGRPLTRSGPRSVGIVTDAEGSVFVHEQLEQAIGEHSYGLGERFGAFVKNGQSVDVWNEDGGTASEYAYKNVPFYLTDAGYGVFVDHPGPVSFEMGSEVVSRNQFSVPGERLRYFLIYGPTPKEILRRYTALTGRPARVPAWSFGLWLSTSFTTEYDEATVTSFVDGMAERDLPLSVFHFDCFWMRQFHWCDFVWDPATFPDPDGMLKRLHAKGLRISVWVNPYIAQRSYLFDEGRRLGYLVTRHDGSVWQWDHWQAGMALVDFTNPDAAAWYSGKLKTLLDNGVDAIKTDFGERIPTDVVWHDGSDPERMHNYYAHLYNQCVFDLLERERGKGEAVLFARSATAGGQQFPVHWGGDAESTFSGMAESLRGGLSLAASGFGYWSHDIGGFEGTPDPAVFKRWIPFGLLSSHSRLHGSGSYRVPWHFDEESVDVLRKFTRLKLSLTPYLLNAAEEAASDGIPVVRPMVLEFPDDPTAALCDRQYMLGPDLLVAPVFTTEDTVQFYVPEGAWTDFLTGEVVQGPKWVTQQHGFDSVPLLARPGAVIPLARGIDAPDDAWSDGLTIRAPGLADGERRSVRLPAHAGSPAVEYVVEGRPDGPVAEQVAGEPTEWRVDVVSH